MAQVTFEAQAVANSPTGLTVTARGFEMKIDEPPSLGGANEGPNPVEYVLAAIMGCMNVVVHEVAKERGVALRGLSITARGSLNPAKFMGRPTTDRAGLDDIEIVLSVDSDANDDVIAEIVRVAEERCPVSDNLAHPTRLLMSTGRAA